MTANRLLAKALNKLGHQFAPGPLRLPLIYYGYLLNHPEPELTQLATFLRGRRVALDVGANIGLWSYKLARLFAHVHSFEPNPDCHPILKNYGHRAITLHENGLSNRNDVLSLYEPISANGFVAHGWGTVETARKETLFQRAQQRSVTVKPLDSYGFTDVDFIKIDVEGHERAVVEGGLDTIRRHRPAMVIETSPERLSALHELLGPLGYRATSLRPGPTDDDQNFLFIPE